MESIELRPKPNNSAVDVNPSTVVVCILGMHRSGTSCLAGCLQEAGLEMGDVVKEAPYNRKGNRENLNVRRLNDRVLEYSGGSWNRPPHQLKWLPDHSKRRDEILTLYSDAEQWGFKDPRTTLTLPFWRDGWPRTQLVGTFRHPLSVARSLAMRDGIPLSEGMALWRIYNERLLAYYREQPFPLISFDLTTDAYRLSIQTIIAQLGLTVDAEGPHFIESTLVHQKNAGEDGLDRGIIGIYRELQAALGHRG